MPKTYLRYVLDRTAGVIASPACNVAVDASGSYVCSGALEDVNVYMVATGRLVRLARYLLLFRVFITVFFALNPLPCCGHRGCVNALGVL